MAPPQPPHIGMGPNSKFRPFVGCRQHTGYNIKVLPVSQHKILKIIEKVPLPIYSGCEGFYLTFFCQILPLCRFWTIWKLWCHDVVDNFNPINYFKEYSIITCTTIAVGRKNIYTSLSRSRTWWRVFNKSGLACNQCCGYQWPVFPSWPGRAPSRERATSSYFTRLQVNWCSGPESWVTEAFLLFLMGIIKLKICFFPDPLVLPAFPLTLDGHVPLYRSACAKWCKHCVSPPQCCPAPARYCTVLYCTVLYCTVLYNVVLLLHDIGNPDI